jgi:hypothetical protein
VDLIGLRLGFRRGVRECWFRMLGASSDTVCNVHCAQILTGGTTKGGATLAWLQTSS